MGESRGPVGRTRLPRPAADDRRTASLPRRGTTGRVAGTAGRYPGGHGHASPHAGRGRRGRLGQRRPGAARGRQRLTLGSRRGWRRAGRDTGRSGDSRGIHPDRGATLAWRVGVTRRLGPPIPRGPYTEGMEPAVLYEDNHCLAVAKPAPLLTQGPPAAG